MNALYDKAREAFGNGSINLGTDTIKAILVDAASYSPDTTTHQYLSSVPGGARIGTAVTLGTKSNVGGVFDAADVSFTGLVGAPTIEYILIYKDTGADATSPLIAIIDGFQNVTVSAAAAGGATSISLDPVLGAIGSGATLSKVSGTGPSTITTSGSAGAGSRAVAVTALGSAVAAGDVYSVAINGVGLPVAAGATQVDVAWDNGVNKIFKI